MKKILALVLLLFLSMPVCFAQEQASPVNNQSVEDIDSYFVDDSEVDQVQQAQQLDGGVEYNQILEEPEKNAVNLDSTDVYKSINLSKPKSIESKSIEVKAPMFTPIQDTLRAASRFSSQEYNIKPVSTEYSKKYGQFSFGTGYNSSLHKASANYSTELFARYDNKQFALTGGYSKSTNSNYDSYNDTFYIEPEFKITKRLSLLDVMSADVMQINKKNEIVLRYRPNFTKYADNMELELSAGQSFYNDSFVKSSVGFATKFRL